MRGVATDTGGPPTARGQFRVLILAGIALCAWLYCTSSAVGQGGPKMGGTTKRGAPKVETESDERRVDDLISQRTQAQAGEKYVDILVEGLTTIPAAAVLQKIKTQVGRPASLKQVQDDVRTLYRTRWFMTIEPEYRKTDKGMVLVFKVIERPIVRSVEYIGNTKIKTKKLAEQTGLKVGSPYDVNANKEAARKLESFYREKGYPEVTIKLEKGSKRDDRDVAFRIHEGEKQKVLMRSFEGNTAFSDEVLVMSLKSGPAYLGFISGNFDPANLPEDVAGVRQYYQDLGYFDAKVEPEVLYSENRKWIRLVYHVKEGLHYKVRNISMMGNQRFTTEELLKELKVHEGSFYNAHTLKKDIDRIKKKYAELGYYYITKGVELIPRYLEQPGQIDLLLRIDEDRPYSIRNIRIHIAGDHPRTKRSVAYDYIQLAPGDVADPYKIDKSKNKLSGAQTFKVDPGGTGAGVNIQATRVKDDSKKDILSFRGQSGDGDAADSVFSDRPVVRGPAGLGVPLVPRTVLTPQPASGEFEAHDPFNPFDKEEPHDCWTDEDDIVIRGQNAPDPFADQANPLFTPSPQGDPYTNLKRDPQGQIDLDYYLSEERTGKLMFGVGVNSSSGLVGSIVLQEQNFDFMRAPQSWDDILNGTAWRGAGQRFRIEAMPGTVVSRYTISWSDPYFMHTNWSVGASGYYFQRYYLDWTEDRAGGRITVGRQLMPHLSVSSFLRLEGVRIANAHFPTPQILEEVLGDNFLSTVRASMIHDTRDMPFLPGEGHRVEVGIEQGFGQFNYTQPTVDARQYFTLYSRPDGGGRQILTVGGQMGWTGNGTPIFERFFAGGFQSFRGFMFRGVSPSVEGVYTGGQFMAVGSIEYMVPLLANSMVQLVTFTDFGTVDDGVSFGAYRQSIGAGFRVAIPMMGPVPLAFDFGVPIIRQSTDITQVFSFYVGMTR